VRVDQVSVERWQRFQYIHLELGFDAVDYCFLSLTQTLATTRTTATSLDNEDRGSSISNALPSGTRIGSDVLILEAFYGGSHRQLVDILRRELVPGAQLFTLPAKKWQWRLRTAAIHFAEVIPKGRTFRLIFASSTMNMAEFLALRPDLNTARKVIYFHENQLCYPVREQKERYGYTISGRNYSASV